MYDPAVGRWLSQDPIGFEGGDANLYRMVGNATTMFVDPDGLQAQSAGVGQQAGGQPATPIPPVRGSGQIVLFMGPGKSLPTATLVELNRILDAVEKNFCQPGYKFFMYDSPNAPGPGQLGFFTPPTKGVIPGSPNAIIKHYGVEVREGAVPRNALGIRNVNTITYSERRIRDVAQDLRVSYEVALAAVLAHEIVHHAICGVTAHGFGQPEGYIDSRSGGVGGVFSPETSRSLLDEFGFPIRPGAPR